jgi:hypothetical protein
MNPTKMVALVLLVAGLAVFLIPQTWPRRVVKRWTDGSTFVFWTVKVVALTAILLGITGLILGK